MERGMITDEIILLAKELLDIELTQPGLRLMPYIQYLLVNDMHIDRQKVNRGEMSILKEWMASGFIVQVNKKLEVTKKFWDAINEILWIGYARD